VARNVNVTIENFRQTGSNVPFPQYAVDLDVSWTNAAGENRQHSETVLFPNILAQMPAAWLKQELQELVFKAVRQQQALDEEARG
jgi:hypothetical protein